MGIPSDDHLHGYSFNLLWNVLPGQAEQPDILNIPLKKLFIRPALSGFQTFATAKEWTSG
jgi:hypothetical protein